MKIVYIVNDISFFLSHRFPTAVEALNCGYEVHVITNTYNKNNTKKTDIFFHHVSFSRSSFSLFNEFLTIFKIFKIFKIVKPDVICNETVKPVLYGTLTSKLVKTVPVINTITGLGYLFISKKKSHVVFQKVLLLLYRYLFYRNVHVIFENNDDANLFINNKVIHGNSYNIIKGAGVDTKQIKPKKYDRNPITVVLVARMLWDKGVGEFVEAARLVKNKENVKFILVGGIDAGNPSKIDQDVINNWVEEGLVEWTGYQKNVVDILNKSHIACLPSYREGLPKSLIEAASAGLPIVTTNVPGCSEVVDHGFNGLIVPPRNSILLAEAILLLVKDENMRKKMGLNSRNKAIREFDLEIVINSTLEIYRKAINGRL